MHSIIFMLYEIVAALPLFLMIVLMFRHMYSRKGHSIPEWYYVAITVFFLYMVGVYHVTGAGTVYDGLRYGLEPGILKINVAPFSHDIDPTAYLLNVVMLIPFGLLTPLIWKKMNKLTSLVGMSFFFTLLIEISQLVNHRQSDIDDILMNMLGALLGFAVFKIWDRCTKSKLQLNHSIMAELPVYMMVILLGRFLFYNEMGLARLLYGF